jgi:LmbE family N-acetylglucosaminyl deacetylase
VAWVRRLTPDVVLGHDPTAVFFGQEYFNHRDHRTAGWALLDALAPASALPHYFPKAGPPHQVKTVYLSGTLEPDVWVDVSDTVALKAAAVECHRSQFSESGGWAGEAVRLRAEEEGRRAGVPYAEGFRRLRLGG